MVGAGVAMTLLASTMTPVRAQGPACSRMQFEAVVADAAGALRDLNAQNRPLFQSKLRALKDKRGWSHEQFLREATPLVQDTTTETYDKESTSFLEKIQSMGEEGATAKEPDCSHLTELRTTMQSLVASQNAKWQYMLKRVDEELAK
jgi:hypothetical protein